MKPGILLSRLVTLIVVVALLASPCFSQNSSSTEDEKNSSSPKVRWHLGTITVGAAYTHFSGPWFYSPFWTYGFYPVPFYHYGAYGLGYAPGFWYPSHYFDFNAGKGNVKLSANVKNAQVQLNGAYAGVMKDLKSIWLEPGAYDLELSAPDHTTFQKRIYVLSGKTLKIQADLQPLMEEK
ncbi:MAG TPA: PEGA domain-containing protein [Candidatus Angelobacter sp.]